MSFTANPAAAARAARYTPDFREIDPDLSGNGLRIGIVMSRFNREIGEGLLSGCCQELRHLGVRADDVTLVTVPGALELPLALRALAVNGRFDALVALGCVVRGETYHFEIVANESARGIGEVQLTTGVPVANGVLTVENDDQASVRMHQKGLEAAQTAIEIANLLRAVR